MRSNIRNFCIIAHIDHGKSTLADRFLEITGTVEKRDMKAQILDTMDIEQERGITIKLQPVRMEYKDHILNLIDTPGHVDFSYEVSRSLAAVEGAILVVDASQGIQAQTLANLYIALENNLTIIPVVNKIDLPQAQPEETANQLKELLGDSHEDIIFASAKDGRGVDEILDAVIDRVPAPEIENDKALTALIFDSIYDPYRGVILYVRLVTGSLQAKKQLMLMRSKAKTEALEVGVFKPQMKHLRELRSGEIGYVVTSLKTIRDAKVGDTVTLADTPASKPLPGYKQVTPYVFSSFYTVSQEDFGKLRDALEKLQLNDSSLSYTPENSPALGFGFRLGFLGLLHLEIVKERLEREYSLELIVTVPSVSYEITTTTGESRTILNPTELPEPNLIAEFREPWVAADIVAPKEYVGAVIELSQRYRGVMKNIEYLDETRGIVHFELPLASILIDYYDNLKSISKGYASLNYSLLTFRAGNLVRLDILVAGELVPPLSRVVETSEAEELGRKMVEKLKEAIPKQQFAIPLQAAIGAKIIARETISAFRKDVTAKLYGGDVTRKRKLLEKQKKGKEKMKRIGAVEIPSDIFIKLLKK